MCTNVLIGRLFDGSSVEIRFSLKQSNSTNLRRYFFDFRMRMVICG